MINYEFISKGRLDGVVVDVAMPVKIPALSLKKLLQSFHQKRIVAWLLYIGLAGRVTSLKSYINTTRDKEARKGK